MVFPRGERPISLLPSVNHLAREIEQGGALSFLLCNQARCPM
jgi:hypothetical protein